MISSKRLILFYARNSFHFSHYGYFPDVLNFGSFYTKVNLEESFSLVMLMLYKNASLITQSVHYDGR